MNLDQALDIFFAESREGLEAMEHALLGLADADAAARDEDVAAIFRAAHTIKGSAGLFGLDRIVAFTHVLESVLDRVRAGTQPIDEPLVALLLASGDHIGTLIDAAERTRADVTAEVAAAGTPLLERLQACLEPKASPGAAAAPGDRPGDPVGTPAQASPTGAGEGPAAWALSLRFGRELLRNGMDPLSLIRYLATLGHLRSVVTVEDALPAAGAMDPEASYLGFEIVLDSDATPTQIEQAFDFVREDSRIVVAPLLRGGAEPSAAASTPAQAPVALPAAIPAAVAAASAAPVATAASAAVREARTVRVDADKLDRLVDLVGELVIATAGANLIARAAKVVALEEAHSTLDALVQGVRDSALSLRMVKIGATFGRFQRVVHDVSRELGKDIALVVSGEDTELDKTVVERIADPLMHLVRNAIDHGIEPAALRAERGKPARGTLRLNAFHDSGSIVIEVGDDGGGLKRERILAKAVERGLVEPGRVLSDAEVHALIFEPGFSTADQVTNLSGRGVGMDVVRRNIEALRGSVQVDSAEGRGTTISVRLPLTLAIINGFQVAVGDAVFVVPLEMVDECVAHVDDDGRDYTDLRGEVLPLLRLRDALRVTGPRSARQNVVVVRHAGQKVGFVVDTLLGEFQTVIKPLAPMFSGARGISGSSIRGSGEVALILDVPTLLQRVHELQPLPAGAAAP